jgi:hypothetical protein
MRLGGSVDRLLSRNKDVDDLRMYKKNNAKCLVCFKGHCILMNIQFRKYTHSVTIFVYSNTSRFTEIYNENKMCLSFISTFFQVVFKELYLGHAQKRTEIFIFSLNPYGCISLLRGVARRRRLLNPALFFCTK